MIHIKKKKIFIRVLLGLIFSGTLAMAQDDSSPSDTTSVQQNDELILGILKPKQADLNNPNIFVRKRYVFPYAFFGHQEDGPVITRDLVKVSGVLRFLTIYRNMSEAYPDMVTSKKNISFLDYPLANVGTVTTGGFPLLELNLTSQLTKEFTFNVGYSFAHSFAGVTVDTLARSVNSRQNLFFMGNYRTNYTMLELTAGGILFTGLSRFTMGQPDYRDNYFDRMPWDWYRRSFERYEDYYNFSANVGQEGSGRAPVLGYVMKGEIFPLALRGQFIYGRTNRNLGQATATTFFPSITYAGRLEKTVFTRMFKGKVGVTYYKRSADVDRFSGTPDDNSITSLDYRMKVGKIIFASEMGTGTINNPSLQNVRGYGFNFRTEIDKEISAVPVYAEYYWIDKNMVSLDGSIINSNVHVKDAGYTNDLLYSNFIFINLAQEVGQMANNRQGVNLRAEAKVERLKIDIGYATSQELENMHDTVTFQHRVNAFSRSRFRPWFQAGGPYGRIKSFWLRTFETITIRDRELGIPVDYKKGFNSLDVFMKYRFNFLGKEIILLNFNNYVSIQDHFSVIPKFNDQAFIRTFYEDITAAIKVGRKTSLVGNYGYERVWGNYRTNLSPETGKPIDQTGHSYAVGIDYDFSPVANLHLRHRWMNHKDKNFLMDRFRGQETYFELKIFFN
ncbi:MAG: hypothetical protein ACK40G_13145 [Cytophagaceae bacterium]